MNINSVTVKKCRKPSKIIASIPHSAYKITSEMKQHINDKVVFTNNDWFLNELYSFLNELDINTVSANYSRYVIDVNRKMEFKENHEKYTDSLIYFNTTFNKQIYAKMPSEEDIKFRIENIYDKYHECLLDQINTILKEKNKVYLFDLHSFFAQSDADVVLGTREGTTCSKEFLDIVYNAFTDQGFNVKIDEKGLRGGYITYHYASMDNVEAVQIEIRYTSYIEDRYFGEEYMPKIDYQLFNKTQSRLKKVFKVIKEKIQ